MPQGYKIIFQQSSKVTHTVFFKQKNKKKKKAGKFQHYLELFAKHQQLVQKKSPFFSHQFEPSLFKCLEISFKSQADTWHQLEICAATP